MGASDERALSLFQRISTGQAQSPTILEFGGDRVVGESADRSELRPRLDYFDVSVNELFLSYRRKWFKTYDPLVYTVVEFQYGSERRAVPFVVGPQLVRGAGNNSVPDAQGIVFTDTRIAGLYPLTGGTVALTAMLCRVQQDDYARGVLRMLEKVAGAIDVGAVLTPYLRIADVVMDGIDDLTSSGTTQLLAGFRSELNPGKGIRSPSYYALIAQQDVDPARLWVRARRLVEGNDPDAAVPYRNGDFVLISLCAQDTRDDIELLPFYPLWEQVSREARRAVTNDLWEQRAKGSLYTLAEAIYDSPDLTDAQRDILIDDYEQRAVILRDKAKRRTKLGPQDRRQIEARPKSAAILGL